MGIVHESLVRIGRMDAAAADALVEAGGSVSPSAYRTTVRVVGDADGRPGFRRHQGDDVVAVDSCLVAHPGLSDVLRTVEVDPGVEVTLRVSAATGALTAVWKRGGRDAVRGLPDATHIGPRAWLRERVVDVDLRVSADAFFQSGPGAAELLVDAVGRAAPEAAGAGTVVDAYGGGGLFAATALRTAGHVIVLESSRVACDDARHNLDRRRARVVRGDVARWRAAEPVDLLVADPARAGLGRRGVDAVVSAAPAPIVLVSCDPVSLARDAALLAEHGYRPERVEVLDLFPNTHHVETVTRFST